MFGTSSCRKVLFSSASGSLVKPSSWLSIKGPFALLYIHTVTHRSALSGEHRQGVCRNLGKQNYISHRDRDLRAWYLSRLTFGMPSYYLGLHPGLLQERPCKSVKSKTRSTANRKPQSYAGSCYPRSSGFGAQSLSTPPWNFD